LFLRGGATIVDPLAEIENAKAQHDIGVTAYRIFNGARAAGASRTEAFLVISAWFYAMFDSSQQDEEEVE